MTLTRVIDDGCHADILERDRLRDTDDDYRRRLGSAGLNTPRAKDQTFVRFERARQPVAFDRAVSFAGKITHPRLGGWPVLVLESSTRGTGKSHLATAICRHHLRDPRQSAQFVNVPDLRERLLAGSTGEMARLADQCAGTDLLVLDDWGQEKPSEWFDGLLFGIVDARYRFCSPLVITTNLGLTSQPSFPQHVGPSLTSRILEAAEWVTLTPTDYRAEKMRRRLANGEPFAGSPSTSWKA